VNTHSVVKPIRQPRNSIVVRRPSENTESEAFLGFSFITFFSGGSKPRAIAGRPSVAIFTSRICMGSNATGKPISIPTNMVSTSPILQERR
jgi:hypothetical protein